jgi:hypothetical protein
MKKAILLVFFMSVLISCKYCYTELYQTNVRPFLFISDTSSMLSNEKFIYYIDSVTTRYKAPDSIRNRFQSLRNDERILYFKDFPNEAYLISFTATPCWIEYLYNSRHSHELVGDRKLLSDKELARIQARLAFVMKQAESLNDSKK